MSKIKNIFFLLIIGFFIFSLQLWAGEIMYSPDQMETKSFQVSLYVSGSETKPVLRLSRAGSIQVPVSGGTSSVFNETNADVKMTEKLDFVIASVILKPRDGLSYRFKIGQVRSFNLMNSSGSFTNTLSSNQNGFIWGGGVRWNITQGTIVSSAINLDFGYTQTLIDIDRFESNSSITPINQRFFQDEYQGALSISKRWHLFEPYGGLKIFRVVSHLQDRSTKEQLHGTVDGLSPFVGLKIEIFDREYLMLEGSLVDEKAFSAGMSVRF